MKNSLFRTQLDAYSDFRTGLTNLNTPISGSSTMLIGLIGQKIEGANGKRL